MSEYQYYEFLAVDRPLDAKEQQALRDISTRARITATGFTNHYEWGDLKANPTVLLERYFDLHVYVANWGTRRLMVRLPGRFADIEAFKSMAGDVEWVETSTSGDVVILDFWRDDESGFDEDWDDGSGWIAALAPLRTDLISGDFRLFYLVWLSGIGDGIVDDAETAPLSGIGPLTGALEAFASFCRIDPDLVEAAVKLSPSGVGVGTSEDSLRDALAAIPEDQKTDLLCRLVDGDPYVVAELKRKVRMSGARPAAGLHTAGELRARAAAIREIRKRAAAERRESERRRAAERAERERRVRLDSLLQRGTSAWDDVEEEIGRRNAAGYDAAVRLLSDLQVLAVEQGATADFARRLAEICERHARKGKFIERLHGITAR